MPGWRRDGRAGFAGGDPTILALFTLVRNRHRAFATGGPRAEEITKICRAMGVVMDSLNPIRNHASVAHPNKELLEEPEAMLVINTTRTIIHYPETKLA
ncbi:MAG TPA: abortive infection family protein [Gemmataceae bacterium]|nr:abortive infection family protein [Gemmataceae bacterium]